MSNGAVRLLAGPILRRVEPRLVSVWVALDKPGSVKLDLYASPAIDVGSSPGSTAQTAAIPLASATTQTTRAGDKFHLGLVALQLKAPAAPLMAAKVYSYNVTITAGGAVADLRSLGLLKDVAGGDNRQALGYAEGRLPTFATAPDTLADLRIVHGSCNKMHGFGEPLLQHLDDIIKDAVKDPLHPEVRPHQLFMTGDQIYADDVATAFLPGLTQIGRELLGIPEVVPLQATGITQVTVDQASLPAGRRQALMDGVAGMTSNEANNHLIGFGEYAALYLLTFSPEMWPSQLAVAADYTPPAGDAKAQALHKAIVDDRTGSGPSQQPGALAATTSPLESLLTPLFGQEDRFKGTDIEGKTEEIHKLQNETLDRLRDTFLKDKKKLLDVKDGVWKVRRAMANVPVYAICDDHEITDDWFLTQSWRQRVLGSPLGHAVVRNGLLAYILFQGWGNDPLAFSTGPGQQLLALVPNLFPGDGGRIKQADADKLDDLLGLKTAPPQMRFDYTVEGPLHKVLVLDTRNRREYRSLNSPPTLLSSQALQDQIPAGPLRSGLKVLIVISPAQVFGPRLMDELVQPLSIRTFDVQYLIKTYASHQTRTTKQVLEGININRPFGDYEYDNEGWQANPPALERLMARLATYSSAVVLAGDVHYASSYTTDYYPKGKPPARFVHFTCSAFQNETDPSRVSLLNSSGFVRTLQRAALPAQRLGWRDPQPAVLDDPSGEPPSLRGRLRRAPVLIPPKGWRKAHTLQRQPDWFWELNPIVDVRSDDDRPPEAALPSLNGTDLPPFPAGGAPPVSGLMSPKAGAITFPALAAAHQKAMDHLFFGRGVVFLNNMALLSFSEEGGVVTVSQRLYSLRPSHRTGEDTQAYTLHSAPLAAPPAPAVSVGP